MGGEAARELELAPSLCFSFFRSFFHYFYMYDVREIVWWRSLQKDKIILSTIQPLDCLTVRYKWQ